MLKPLWTHCKADESTENVVASMSSDKFFTTEASWQQLPPSLRSERGTTVVTCHAAPVQLEGMVPTGEHFYFCCRQVTCSLGIGGINPADSPA